MSENSITIPDHVDKFVGELEESARTGVIVAYNSELVGVMGIADPLKREAPMVVELLRRMGVRSIMVTGDNWRTARAVAKEVRIISFLCGLAPVWFGYCSFISRLAFFFVCGMSRLVSQT